MKKYILGAVIALSVFALPASTYAASNLTSSQISSIIQLLRAFNADESVINNVEIALNGGTTQTGTLIPSDTFVNFTNVQGAPTSYLLHLTNSSSASINFTLNVTNQPSWWNTGYNTETMTLQSGGVMGVGVSVDPSKVSSPGNYMANLVVSGNFANSPIMIPVTLTVTAATTDGCANGAPYSSTTGAACPTTPSATALSVDLKANGSDNPSAVQYNSTFNVSWTSTGASDCSASGHYVPLIIGESTGGLWTDLHNLSTSGSETLIARHNTYGYLTPLQLTIQCTSNNGTQVTDTVFVPVTQTAITDGCANGTVYSSTTGAACTTASTTTPPPSSDLIVQKITSGRVASTAFANTDTISFTVTIQNIGGTDVTSPFILAIKSNPDAQYSNGWSASQTLQGIRSGETQNVPFQGAYLMPSGKDYAGTITATVDSQNNVAESNETNNTLQQYITVSTINNADGCANGAVYSLTTGALCPTTPSATALSVDLKANGSDNPSAVQYNSTFNVSWTSTGASNCSASGHYVPLSGGGLWTDLHNLPTSGNEAPVARHDTVGYLTPLQLTIHCTSNNGTQVTDTVSVPVTQTAPAK